MIKKSIGLKVFILPFSLALVVMLAILYVKPAINNLLETRKALNQEREKLTNLKNQESRLSAIKSKWETMDEDRKRLQNALPEGQDADTYLDELYSRVSRSGVLLNSFSADEKGKSLAESSNICLKDASNSGNVSQSAGTASSESSSASASPVASSCPSSSNVKISVSGNWDQILSLLAFLADTNRIANATSLNVSSAASNQTGESGDMLAIGIDLQIFNKPLSSVARMETINTLAASGTFSEKNLIKLKNIVYSIYEEPFVSETGERNIFK